MSRNLVQKVYVSTPNGLKYHGKIEGGTFIREVDYQKDRMRIFDAWSIHPDALIAIRRENVQNILFLQGAREYYLTAKELESMLQGLTKDAKNRKLAWEDEFKGGRTVYIRLTAFNKQYLPKQSNQQTLL